MSTKADLAGTWGLFRDERGFTTVGMVLALLITLSLLFSTAQVYRIASVSADVQNVADAAALAVENEVAEFMVAVRVCDAVVLSLSLTGVAALGLGVAALCTPTTAALSEALCTAGRDVLKARDSFAENAAEGLDRLQRLLPFFAAANGASVATANDGGPLSSSYLCLAILVPWTGEDREIASAGAGEGLAQAIEAESDELGRFGEEAERAAERSNIEKERGFLRDCGAAPGYCMYERAASLSELPAAENPRYHTVDTWSFSVALERAKAYYRCRLSEEAPECDTVEESARSALRARFYAFAAEEVGKGYVHETADSFDALFPRLPSNTEELRATKLYTEPVYPISESGEGLTMHAWSGCPSASGSSSHGSIAQMESGTYVTCQHCGFTAASLGKVAAASTSIENGFEFHYEAVADACDSYKKARSELDPLSSTVKEKAGSLFDRCFEVLEQLAGERIDSSPPGRFGVVAFVVANASDAPTSGFESSFVSAGEGLGARVALSAATLLSDSTEEGKDILSSFLDSLADEGTVAVGMADVVLECWSSILHAYLEGQKAVDEALGQAVEAIPFASASGLGTWASESFCATVSALGLEPAKLDALKPVLVNSAHVASADDTPFSVRLLSVKERALSYPSESTDVFLSVVDHVEKSVLETISFADGRVPIASIEVIGEGGPSIPITIALPPAVKSLASGFVESVIGEIKSVYVRVSGVRVWE